MNHFSHSCVVMPGQSGSTKLLLTQLMAVNGSYGTPKEQEFDDIE